MRNTYLAAIAGLSLAVSAFDTHATIVYEQVPGDDTVFAAFSSVLDRYRAADDFTLPTKQRITGLTWWGVVNHDGRPIDITSDFEITIYADEGGKPGAPILQSSQGVLSLSYEGVSSFPAPVYHYVYTLDKPFSAEADTTYWLSIFNRKPDVVWWWLGSRELTGNGFWQMTADSFQWRISGWGSEDLSFQLAVPEPAALSLMVAGALMLAWRNKPK